MPLLSSIVSWLMIKRLSQIELYDSYSVDIQKETLQKLLHFARYTEWGRRYDFSTISSSQEFSERIPLNDYNSLKKDINRIRQGEQNVLWPSAIRWFAKSSGTTEDKSKFLPVSNEAIEMCHFRGGKDVLALYTRNNPGTKFFTGKGLVLGGSRQINNISNDSYFGDLSAILIQNMPFWAQFIRTPDMTVALMDEWEEKIEKMAQLTSATNVTSISGVPSWTLVLINKILNITKASNIKDVWPNLELFIHGGVSFTPYRDIYKKIFDFDGMHYMETYNASEGFFAIQDDIGRNDMLLMLDLGIYYEFIPFDKYIAGDYNSVGLDGVERGVNYVMVISTNSGLWRYVIGDTVQFTSKCPFRVRITGRIKHFINTFGEELIVENADKAIHTACVRTNAELREYTAAPVYMKEDQQGAHQWLIEFISEPNDITHFAEVLDNELKSLNSDYEAKRYRNMTLHAPVVTLMRKQGFYEWLKQKEKLGGQHKVPRLVNDRSYMDELLAINRGEQITLAESSNVI